MSPTKVETPKPKTPGKKGKSPKFTPPVTRRRSMKPQTPKVRTPKVEPSKAASPKKEAPKAVSPKVEVQKLATPKVAKQKNVTPKLEVPKITTPKAEKRKAETPKAETPKQKKGKADGSKSPKKQKLESGDAKQSSVADVPRKERKAPKTQAERLEEDKRTLFVKGLTKDIKQADIEGMTKAIVQVRMLAGSRKNNGFAYIVFKTEGDAAKQFKSLKKIGQVPVSVDYVGEKSKQRDKPKKSKKKIVDPKMLYITGPPMTDVGNIRRAFPKAFKFDFPTERFDKNRMKGFAFAHFKTAEDAQAAMKSCKNVMIDGKKLVVRQATVRPDNPKYKRKLLAESRASSVKTSKKQKKSKKVKATDSEDKIDEDSDNDDGPADNDADDVDDEVNLDDDDENDYDDVDDDEDDEDDESEDDE